MPTDADFLLKRDYTPSELAASIKAIKQFINTATPINTIDLYDENNNLVLTLAGRGYLNGSSLSLNGVTAPVRFAGN